MWRNLQDRPFGDWAWFLGLNKERGLKFRVCSQIWQTPEEGWKTYQLKHEYNNKDEDNSLKTEW